MHPDAGRPAGGARIVDRVSVLRGWVNVDRVAVAMPDGAIVERHVEDHGPGAAVLPYDPDRRVALLIEQPRAAVLMAGHAPVLEVIAGRLDDSGPAERIVLEAMEEGGVRLHAIEPVAQLWSMPSISTERLHLYLAPYCAGDRLAAGGGSADEHENITVHEIALATLADRVRTGALPDAKTLILVQALMLRRPDLFI